jgi:hypothetical protein
MLKNGSMKLNLDTKEECLLDNIKKTSYLFNLSLIMLYLKPLLISYSSCLFV